MLLVFRIGLAGTSSTLQVIVVSALFCSFRSPGISVKLQTSKQNKGNKKENSSICWKLKNSILKVATDIEVRP